MWWHHGACANKGNENCGTSRNSGPKKHSIKWLNTSEAYNLEWETLLENINNTILNGMQTPIWSKIKWKIYIIGFSLKYKNRTWQKYWYNSLVICATFSFDCITQSQLWIPDCDYYIQFSRTNFFDKYDFKVL